MENTNSYHQDHPSEISRYEIDRSNTSYFSDHIFPKLPSLLQSCCNHFLEDKRDRDVVLISSLITLSACFPNIYGTYLGSKCYANLYGIIIAPPASGKGNAKFPIQMANEFHDFLFSLSNCSINPSKTEIKKEKNGGNRRRFVISANASSAALLEDLKTNEGIGCLMFDSELDTASSISKQDWGNQISEILRKCFHHERLSVSRKSDGFFDIEAPKLSVLFTGTNKQLQSFIDSVGDGLFSRFLFYKFESMPVWKDVCYNGGIKFHEYFSELSLDLVKIIQYYIEPAFEYNFDVSQFSRFNATFEHELKMLNSQYGEAVQGIVKRMGLITFKISMILTALRCYDKVGEDRKLVCSDDDLRLAFDLYSTFIHHSLGILKDIPDIKYNWQNEKMEAFYDSLPGDAFKREKAIEKAESLSIPIRTADDWLSKFKKDSLLSSPETGYYKKTE